MAAVVAVEVDDFGQVAVDALHGGNGVVCFGFEAFDFVEGMF
jgi:hypothetical protein